MLCVDTCKFLFMSFSLTLSTNLIESVNIFTGEPKTFQNFIDFKIIKKMIFDYLLRFLTNNHFQKVTVKELFLYIALADRFY